MQRIKIIANNPIGHPISNANLIMHILNGLGPTYDNLTPSIVTCVDSLTLEEVNGILSSHEHLLQMRNTYIFALSINNTNHQSYIDNHGGVNNCHRGRGQGRG